MKREADVTAYWRRWTFVLAGLCGMLFLSLIVLLFLASRDSTTHYNLSYLMWKKGWRDYDSSTALSGLWHDRTYQKSLIGISEGEFQKMFPHTFYEMVNPPPIARPGQRWFIDSYEESKRANGGSLGWIAVFEKGKLVEFELVKGP